MSKKKLVGGATIPPDGPVRVTVGPDTLLVGGDRETHEKLTETAVKFQEGLAKDGKRMKDISHGEAQDRLAEARYRTGK